MALGYSGDYATARTWFEAIVQAHENTFGPGHPHARAARQDLARWKQVADDR
jgi:hypothetical protein